LHANVTILINTVNTGVSVGLFISALGVSQLVHQNFVLVPVLEREKGDNHDDKVDQLGKSNIPENLISVRVSCIIRKSLKPRIV
jgi:hypothetical protein